MKKTSRLLNKLKITLTALNVMFSLSCFAQTLNDGPYVFYKDQQLIIKKIVAGKVTEEVVPLAKKNNTTVKLTFADHPEWAFDVKLKPDHQNEPSVYEQPEKMFFISDIEGEFEGFRKLLIAAKIMDDKYNWTFGKGHLVFCGDMFDRGLMVTECLWLIYKLEQSARKSGGYVHTILGNHDIMNLSGTIEYVDKKYFDAAALMKVKYMDLYTSETELGKWLRSKNTMEKVGDNLCMHAGINPQMNALAMGVEELNKRCRPFYDNIKAIADEDPEMTDFFKGNTSHFWYRGYFVEPKATQAEVDETLNLYCVKRIVVGHTIVPDNIGFYYNGKILGLDVNQHGGDHQGALFEKNMWFKINEKGLRTPLIIK